jgi:2-C-methyl-D-erythritol 4-phosphate cytidylyltransferase/2-C-methyl-D-erythritol 2,4-cyclodiphosphate synthase
MFVSAIIAAAGRGTRIGAGKPKQLLMLGDRSILQRSFELVEGVEQIDEVIVALPAELASAPPAYLSSARKPVRIVDGGARRQDSVARAFAHVSDQATIVVIHDAARPFATADLFSRVIDAAASGGAAVAALQAYDTVKETSTGERQRMVVRTLPRDSVYLAQTPQAFRREVLRAAIDRARDAGEAATDEASLAEQAGHAVRVVEGEPANMKITTDHDLRISEALARGPEARAGGAIPSLRVGVGYDLHRLEPGRSLIIGGVRIPHETGLAGHSDADVLCHAVTDAILGAAGAGDIGQHFPDTDPAWKDADSLELLRRTAEMIRSRGHLVANVDAVVIAERPKLMPHVAEMRANLARALGIDMSSVSVKGKTNEHVDALGRNEAIAVHAVALLARSPESGA